jgi:hypothetical protein
VSLFHSSKPSGMRKLGFLSHPPCVQVYNIIPQYLLLQYTLYRKPLVFNAICKAAMLLSTAVLVLGVVLVWLLYPRSYDYQQVRQGGLRRVGWDGVVFSAASQPRPVRHLVHPSVEVAAALHSAAGPGRQPLLPKHPARGLPAPGQRGHLAGRRVCGGLQHHRQPGSRHAQRHPGCGLWIGEEGSEGLVGAGACCCGTFQA